MSDGAVRTIASGCIFFGVFGAAWLAWGLVAAGLGPPAALGIALAGGLAIVLAARRLPSPAADGAPSPGRRRVMRRFLWINVAQWAAIGAVGAALGRADMLDALPAAVSTIVALHFLALAPLFGTPVYYVTAGVLLAVDAAALLRGDEAGATTAAIGTGLVLWATAVLRLAQAHARRSAKTAG